MLPRVHFKLRRILFGLLLILPLPQAGASGTSLHHDRDGWVASIRGSIAASPTEIQLISGGDITVRGTRSRAITYTVTGHFPGASESAARQAVAKLQAIIERQAGASSLTFPSTSSPYRQSVRLEIPRGIRRVTVISVAGNIDVAELDGAVVARNGAGRTSLDHIGGDAEIQTAGGATVLGLIGGNVHCVSGGGGICARTIRGNSILETTGGEIYAAEALGTVRAHTGGGSIRIGHAGSSVTATTRGGPIEIGRAAGVVIANNSGGPIRVASAPGVHCETASGAIQLTGVSGSVIASTTLGNIVASLFAGRFLGNSILQTGGGDITVLIPSNISVTLKATNSGGAGTIISDYPIRLGSRGPLVTAEGRINGGGPVLQVTAKSGTIFIKRQ